MRGIGLDLIDIERIRRAMGNGRFTLRIYTDAERAQIEARGAQGVQTAAGYFAAKEAVAKALGTGFRGFGPWDIEIFPDELGCPCARLSGGAQERLHALGACRVHLSITHTASAAAAVAILE